MAAFVQKSTVLSNSRVMEEDLSGSSRDVPEEFKLPEAAAAPPPQPLAVSTSPVAGLLESGSLPRLVSLLGQPLQQQQQDTTGPITTTGNSWVLSSDLACAPHVSSCGHKMHATCWQTYFDEVVTSERQRGRRRQPQSYDTDKSEFLCPLCRCLSNSVIPLIPQFHLLQPQPLPAGEPIQQQQRKPKTPIRLDYAHWLNAMLLVAQHARKIGGDGEDTSSKGSQEASAPRGAGTQAVAASPHSPGAESPSSPIAAQVTAVADFSHYTTCLLKQVC